MKIAILTNFMDFTPSYSLTGIVEDQVNMLAKHGNEVHLFVCEHFNPNRHALKLLYEDKNPVIMHHQVPFAHLKDYQAAGDLSEDHLKVIEATKGMLVKECSDMDIIFSHDWVFTGWNLPYAMGILQASRTMDKPRWLHWIHSVPSGNKGWWDINSYGPKHKIVFPNSADRTRVAEQFNGRPDQVRIIPHIKDPRTWWGFCEDTIKFLDDFPNVMGAEILCIYPASSDRLAAKRVNMVLEIISKMKQMGKSVAFICANQWATGAANIRTIKNYQRDASNLGLSPQEFIFTSEWADRKYALGIPKVMLREFLLISNLFIYPTREESYGLAGVEAALSGVLMVHNRSLLSQAEIHDNTGLYVDFGSYYNTITHDNQKAYLGEVAKLILGAMREDHALNSKTAQRRRHNYDALYHNVYVPIMGESTSWS